MHRALAACVVVAVLNACFEGAPLAAMADVPTIEDVRADLFDTDSDKDCLADGDMLRAPLPRSTTW